MEQAANTYNLKNAARYRDQLLNLRYIQERHYIHTKEGDVDAIA